MALTTPPERAAVWADSSGDNLAASTGEQQSGYVIGAKPSRRKTNWLINWIDNAMQWLLKHTIATYRATATYSVDDMIMASGYLWKRIGSGDTTGVGIDDATKWEQWPSHFGDSSTGISASYDAVVSDVMWIHNVGSARELAMKVTLGVGESQTLVTLSSTAYFKAVNLIVSGTGTGPNSNTYCIVSPTDNTTTFTFSIVNCTGTGGACMVRLLGF